MSKNGRGTLITPIITHATNTPLLSLILGYWVLHNAMEWWCITGTGSDIILKTKKKDVTSAALWLSGVPDYFYRNKISSGGDLSHYSSASLC